MPYSTVYHTLLKLAADPKSELFIAEIAKDGATRFFQRGGAAHRAEFWRGVNGIRTFTVRGTLAAECYEAGKYVRKHGVEPAASAIPIDPMTGRPLKTAPK